MTEDQFKMLLDVLKGFGGGQTTALQPSAGYSSLPNAEQLKAFQEAGVDFSGNPIKPQSFSDMTGLQKLSFGMDTIGNLGKMWLGAQQNRLARDTFNLQKGVLDTNLANQIASYNTALEDRVAGRFSDRERAAKQPEINDYLDRNRAVNRMA